MTENSLWHLPQPAQRLLPHKGSMCCIDRLESCSETEAVASLLLGPDHLFCSEGQLEDAAFVELAAQTVGAMNGYHTLMRHQPVREGMLVGVQDFTIYQQAKAGSVLYITVKHIFDMNGLFVFEANIQGDGRLYARGQVKVYANNT